MTVPVEAFERILEQMADGKSLRAACREDGAPDVVTVLRRVAADEIFCKQYTHARNAGDDAMAEDIQAIADDDEIKPDDKRVRIDARKWLLAKRQPKKYGDKLAVGGADDLPALKSQTTITMDDIVMRVALEAQKRGVAPGTPEYADLTLRTLAATPVETLQ